MEFMEVHNKFKKERFWNMKVLSLFDGISCGMVALERARIPVQNRKRCYWTNIPGVEQPEDRGILLRDVIIGGMSYQDKSYCMTARYNGAVFWNTLERRQRTMIAEPIAIPLNADEDEKSRTIKAQYSNTSIANACRQDGFGATMVCEPIVPGNTGMQNWYDNRIYSVRDKSVCLKNHRGGCGTNTCLYNIDLPDGDYIIRKLTPIEAERLQTLPDDYTDGISNAQRYKCIGNGWTVDVIAHIFNYLKITR